MKNIQQIVDKHYDQMFHELVQVDDDSLYEFVIEVKLSNGGTTVRRSWHDRNEMLKEENE